MNQREDFTYRILKDYLKEGMKVLDVGCGTGVVTFLAADIVGASGSVVGIDMYEKAIETALDTLEQRLQSEREKTKAAFIRDTAFGICVKKSI